MQWLLPAALQPEALVLYESSRYRRTDSCGYCLGNLDAVCFVRYFKRMEPDPQEVEFQKRLSDYRAFLWDTEQKVQIEYDKAILLLSGGALGVSFTFLRDVAVKGSWHHYDVLLAAWICWGASVSATLFSFYTGISALRVAGKQLQEKTIFMSKPGGIFRTITHVLNFLGSTLFFAGLLCLVVFVYFNKP